MENEQLIRKQIRSNHMKIATNIVLIIVLVSIGAYVYVEIESFKTLGKDVCRLCEAKTGGTCKIEYGQGVFKEDVKLNLSGVEKLIPSNKTT